jgi:hypothetical protein
MSTKNRTLKTSQGEEIDRLEKIEKKSRGNKDNKKNKKIYIEEEKVIEKNSSEEVEYHQVQTEGFIESRSIGSLLGSILSQTKIGSDVLSSGISLPAWLYEPLSTLQRQAEMMEYSYLLDKAAECKDSIDRMAFIAAFAVSGLSATQRYHNNFNPILGETFEFVNEKTGVKYISEQVSHHPPVSATHAEKGKLWVFYQNSCPTTGFLGNSISIDTQAKTHIYFPGKKEHYSFTAPTTKVHNLILGKMWIEHIGELNVTNLKTRDTCIINFKKCGFFGNSVNYKIEGNIQDSDGNICVELSGCWNEYLEGNWLIETKDSEQDKTEEIWRIYENNFINDKYHLSRYAKQLIELGDLINLLPPTDSRRRLDILQLLGEDPDKASKLKKMIEERQRKDRKSREQNGEEWVPTFFHKNPEEDGGYIWVYCGDYWDQRENKLEKIKEGGDVSDLLNGGNSKGTASDFQSYEEDS